ncbi:hypothetical protein SAMN06265348_10634 [Pedobacter westerhofensis]|uniref:Uncharacterized protein n=1 Tax=Pedobacter westerhofensis TaxID=425512 RepID=A0A521DNL6_9SPHI|nr:hypothetical protein SAMN06265348_10634 [Pedobacter westerhofensis]
MAHLLLIGQYFNPTMTVNFPDLAGNYAVQYSE